MDGSVVRNIPDSLTTLTIRTSKMDPPEARARRAAKGIACSAREEPSNGTSMRLNIASLLSFHVIQVYQRGRKGGFTSPPSPASSAQVGIERVEHLHVVGALEGGWLRDSNLAHAALHLQDGGIL